MFAYVKFIEDGVNLIVNTDDIKKFDIDNFQNGPKKVKYTDGHYYKAHILVIGDSIEEVEQKLKSKRPHIPSSRIVNDTTGTTETSADEIGVPDMSMSRRIKKKGTKDTLHAEISRNIILNSNNEEEVNILKREVMELKRNEKLLLTKIDKLTDLNVKLQEVVINKFEDISWKTLKPNEVPDIEEQAIPPVGEEKQGNVHLGRNIWLPCQIFDSICASSLRKTKKDGIFIKELALAVFGKLTLMNSSVTGVQCNRTKAPAKPKLDPTKLMAIHDILVHRMKQRGESSEAIGKMCASINSCIAEKIHDLTRAPKKKVRASDSEVVFIGEENQKVEGHTLEVNINEIPIITNFMETPWGETCAATSKQVPIVVGADTDKAEGVEIETNNNIQIISDIDLHAGFIELHRN